MAWNCTLYTNFKKRANSTKQPTGGTTYACRLKHDTDFKNPTVEVSAGNLASVNYMQLNGHYYYVTGLVSHRTGVWEVTGMRDPMASFKSDIADVQSLILYNQTSTDASGTGKRVADSRIPVSQSPLRYRETQYISGSFNASPTRGTYLLSAVGESSGVMTYIISQSSMSALITGLNAELGERMRGWFDLDVYPADIIAAVRAAVTGLFYGFKQELAYGNYADCIKACYWIPFEGFSGGSSQRIMLGDYNTGITATCYTSKVLTQTYTITIPWPVEDWKRNNCLVQVYLPFCGTVVLPTDKINNSESVTVKVSLDVIGGTIAYEVEVGLRTILTTGANVAASYAIGSSNITPVQVMQGASQVVGGGVTAAVGAVAGSPGAVVGGITSVASGIAQVITPQVQTVGSMGGLAAAGLTSYIMVELLYYEPINEASFRTNYGYPVMLVGKVGAGYNMCRGFSVECAGTQEEINTINSYFNNGAYYE